MLLEEEFPPDIRVENEINTLTNEGHEITLICTTRKNAPAIEIKKKFKIHRLTLSKKMYSLRAFALEIPIYYNYWYKKLSKKLFDWEQFDVIHVHDLPLAKVGYKLSKKYNLKFVLDLHENRPEIMKFYNYTNTFPGNILISLKRWERYQRKITPKADRLILITEIAKDDYVKRYQLTPNKIYAIPNWPNTHLLDSYNLDPKIKDRYKNKSVYLYFGDTGTRRGTFDILETAEKLKDHKKIIFVIIGNSREQNQLIKESKKLHNVVLTGYLPFEEIASYIMISKVGLCPFHKNLHHDTTYANKLFQFMYFKKPIIASNCIAQQRIIENEKCGLVFKSGNIDEFVERILQIEKVNHTDYLNMGDNGNRVVRSKYNLKNGHKKLIELYNSF